MVCDTNKMSADRRKGSLYGMEMKVVLVINKRKTLPPHRTNTAKCLWSLSEDAHDFRLRLVEEACPEEREMNK